MIKNKRWRKTPKLGTILLVFICLIPLGLYLRGLNFMRQDLARAKRIKAEQTPPPVEEKKYQLCPAGNEKASLTKLETGFEPEQLIIESVGIDLPVVSVPLVRGTWQVYHQVANFAQGTSLVNIKSGNAGLYGHDLPNAFGPIKKIQIGDKIQLFSKHFRADYYVTETFFSLPENVEIFYPTDEPTVTLVTCEGILAQQRFILRANLDRIVEINCE